MEATIVDCNYLYNLDYENKLCLDCRAAMPQYVSINNGVIICQDCATKHKALGFNISYVREIKSEWDPYLLAFVLRGGNSRFIRLTQDYSIESLAIEYKYITKATEYYRLLIKSEVNAEEPPEPLLKSQGIEYCHLDVNYFPEFENYQIYEGEKQPGTAPGRFYSSLKAVGSGLDFIYKRLSQSDIKEKVINGSSMTYNVLKVTGGFIFQKSKPVMNFVSKKATQGVGFIYKQMKEQFLDEEDQKKSAKKKGKGKASMRPRSIGKESRRKFSIGNLNKRSTSTGKYPFLTHELGKSKYYCIDNTNTTSSISLIDEKDEFYFVPVNDYPTYEEIMKHNQSKQSNAQNTDDTINLPYSNINQYK